MNWQWKDTLKLTLNKGKSRQDEPEKQQCKPLELHFISIFSTGVPLALPLNLDKL